jgi:hypothetical protein
VENQEYRKKIFETIAGDEERIPPDRENPGAEKKNKTIHGYFARIRCPDGVFLWS